MAAPTRIGLRRFWFSVHKWIGIVLAIAIIPLCLSGSALVWHDWLEATLNPQRHVAIGTRATLSPDAYVAAARAALPAGMIVASLRLPAEPGEAVTVSAAKPPVPGEKARPGPPQRTSVWLDPASGRVLDVASSSAGAMRFLHVLHGSLQIPVWGRSIVGWIGVAMAFSCLSGLWLWWPTVGRVARGLRWRRQGNFNADLHHQIGFWVVLPLAVLSLTGVWISFPAFFAGLTGGSGPGGPGGPGGMRGRPVPIEARLAPSAAVAAAGGGDLVNLTWPTDKDASWQVAFAGRARREVEVDDATGAATAAEARAPQGGFARLMRRIHDGDGMGTVWQIVIFVGGIIPAILAVTGIIMWLRTRGWRGELARKQKARRAVAAE